jgi:hypothetical protein
MDVELQTILTRDRRKMVFKSRPRCSDDHELDDRLGFKVRRSEASAPAVT